MFYYSGDPLIRIFFYFVPFSKSVRFLVSCPLIWACNWVKIVRFTVKNKIKEFNRGGKVLGLNTCPKLISDVINACTYLFHPIVKKNCLITIVCGNLESKGNSWDTRLVCTIKENQGCQLLSSYSPEKMRIKSETYVPPLPIPCLSIIKLRLV